MTATPKPRPKRPSTRVLHAAFLAMLSDGGDGPAYG